MSIPLVQNNEKDSINTSIIAIKRNIERINMLLGLVDSGSPDLSGLATKQELEDAITQVETDLAPVDEVTSGNMQSVTSNAVAEALGFVDIKSQCTFSSSSTGFYIYKSKSFVLLICDRNAFGSQDITLPSGVNVILRQINYNVTGDYFFAGNTNKISFVSNGNHYINLSALFVIG